jgi:hypothetical protein
MFDDARPSAGWGFGVRILVNGFENVWLGQWS